MWSVTKGAATDLNLPDVDGYKIVVFNPEADEVDGLVLNPVCRDAAVALPTRSYDGIFGTRY